MLTYSIDHAQGGAQAIEDGLVLGLVLHGVTDTSQVEERLAIYQKIRRNRASAIQVLSNYGFEEKAADGLEDYLVDQPIPRKSYFLTLLFLYRQCHELNLS